MVKDGKITVDSIDIPVSLFIRITKKSNEPRERALLIAKDEKGKEYTFVYQDYNDECRDLIVEGRT
jgi:hypothetical protein